MQSVDRVGQALFSGWQDLARIALVAPLCYVALVLLLRIAGKRSLAKLNAFDFVVTVALGSTLSSTLLSRSLAEGVTALGALLALQWLVAWSSVRSATVRRIVKNEPVLLYHRGGFLDEAMRRERVSRDELLQAVRSNGSASLEQTGAVVLETDGTLSVLSGPGGESDSAPAT